MIIHAIRVNIIHALHIYKILSCPPPGAIDNLYYITTHQMLSAEIAAVLFLGQFRASSVFPIAITGRMSSGYLRIQRLGETRHQPEPSVCSQRISLNTSHGPNVPSVPFPPPPPTNQSTSLPSNPPPHIRAHRNSNRPRLPRPIPIQRNGYRAEPRAN